MTLKHGPGVPKGQHVPQEWEAVACASSQGSHSWGFSCRVGVGSGLLKLITFR